MRGRRPPEPILHVDLDAFYASVAVRGDPSLAGRPVVVGGAGPRGVVLSASYEARKFGIHSAMPSARARRLCPDAVFVPPDFEWYRAYATRFREVLLTFTPLVEPLSLDEAFLDVSGATSLFGDPPTVAGRVRDRVREELTLICSVGVAPNKFLAKMASAAAKPDGVITVPAGDVLSFLHPLRVGDLWGVGERTLEVLERLGVRTVRDLAAVPMAVLERVLGQGAATHLTALANGRDDRVVVPYEAPKSVSHEETFDRDIDADDDVNRELLRLSLRVAARLRREGYRARTVVMKVRLASFATLTRSRTVGPATDVGADLHRIASDLYRAHLPLPPARRRIRLLGVAATGLVPAGAEQLALVRGDHWKEAERAVDRIERRFGAGAAGPAALLPTERTDAPTERR